MKGKMIDVRYNITNDAPDISNLVNVTNTTNPLYITHNNPSKKRHGSDVPSFIEI